MAVMLEATRAASTLRARPGRLVIVDAYPHLFGGAQRVAGTIATGLGRRGWQARVLCPREGLGTQRLREQGVPLEVVPAPPALLRYGATTTGVKALRAVAALPRYWWWLARRLRQEADVVWAHDLRGALLAGPAARLARRPMVWHVHAQPPRFAALNVVAARLATTVVAPAAVAVPRGAAGRATVLPNPVRLPDAAADPAGAAPVVVSVGRLHPVKGFDVLLQASARLRAAGVDHRVLIAGGAQADQQRYAESLFALRDETGLDGIVEFCGDIPDPGRLLAQAAVYVQPSRADVLPLATLEAMASALPVVASRVGGLPDAVQDRVSGLLVLPGDPAALADALACLLADPQRRERYGAAGRSRAEADFGEARFLDGVEEICRAVRRDRTR